MLTFEKLYSMGHEEVVFFCDPSCNLKAIVAIHDTTLGPALGGTRMLPYKDEQEAIEDVLRLSRGMTYKSSLAGLNLGGGKAVIIGDPQKDKSEALLRSYGRFLQSLGGRYITAEDVNMNESDLDFIRLETPHVVGLSESAGGSGNPGPYTAYGVFLGIQASCQKLFNNTSVQGRSVAIQGVGSVGASLAEQLIEHKAKVYFTDVNRAQIENFSQKFPTAQFVKPEDFYTLDCDIYSPCALGATVNDQTVEQLRCKMIVGSANNQLKDDYHGEILKKRGILYAPDYLVNAGGVMNVGLEYHGWNKVKAHKLINTIFNTTLKVFEISEKENIPTNKAADKLAMDRLHKMKQIRIPKIN